MERLGTASAVNVSYPGLDHHGYPVASGRLSLGSRGGCCSTVLSREGLIMSYFIGIKNTDNSVWFLDAYTVIDEARKMFAQAHPGPQDDVLCDEIWAVYQLPPAPDEKPIRLDIS